MSSIIKTKIIACLTQSGKKGLSYKELKALCKPTQHKRVQFRTALAELIASNTIVDMGYKIFLAKNIECYQATITKLNKTFGFAKRVLDQSEIFIPGKYLMGALPGDVVLISPIKPRKTETTQKSLEGQVVKILEFGLSEFTGVLQQQMGQYYIDPDSLIKFPIPLADLNGIDAKIGDKVLAQITFRGKSHSEHKAKIISSYGDSQVAASCAESIIHSAGVNTQFTAEINGLAVKINLKGICESDLLYREDLRNDNIFTIDSADAKDLDDAVSVVKYANTYELGVHIADVSHYIKQNSPIDKEAFERGTSIYYADKVIPMLPKALSNGICSLNPHEDRLTFSAIMTIDHDGKLLDYRFQKTVIRSKVKGVYSEINQILNSTANEEINEKYKNLKNEIFLMDELADILSRNKFGRGSPNIQTNESKIILDEKGITVDILPRERGKSESIIEDFMLMANQAAAAAARLKGIAFIYRVHEPPTPQKVERLKEILRLLSINASDVSPDMPPMVLSKIITQAQELKTFKLINTTVLRSMSKAKYSEVPLGHYGLALDDYAHFTSPIRRYPDLCIHRILSDLVSNMPIPKLQKKYKDFVVLSSQRSTETELTAMQLERNCEDCYKAEYMKSHIAQEYIGIISSLTSQGIYVELDNTVEGLIRTDSLPDGNYTFNEPLEYKNTKTQKTYRIGDTLKVKCVKADVNSGNIDFAIVL
ncbi:MAG: ribonuclease R [Oscillospiraceae bacterium]